MSFVKSTATSSFTSTPKCSALSIACAMAFATFASSGAHAATIDLGNDASFSVGAGLRMSYTAEDKAAPDGKSKSSDFNINNVRLYLSGKVTKELGAVINTERNGSDGVRVMDAYATYEPMPEFNIWAGRMLPASDRANLDGPFYLNVWDYPFVSGYPNLAVGRDNGIQAWGKVMDKKLTYVAGMFKGHNRVVGGSNDEAKSLLTGRLAYAFWDVEPAPAYYTGSTYYGAKDILTVGLAAMMQKDGVGTATSKGDYKGYSLDVLMEKKMGGGDALTLEGAYYKTDLDVLDCGSGEPGAPACPAAALNNPDANVGGLVKSKAYLATAAYLFGDKVGMGMLQPFVRYQKLEREVSDTEKTASELGVNYIIKGSNARLAAVYTSTKDTATGGDSIKKITLGAQFQF
jgi:hypothetical protein